MAKISSYASKTTPVNADSVVLIDSEAANVTKRATWTNIKAFLKTYFDTLYVLALASTTEVLTGTNAAKAVTPDALAALWEKGSDIASAGTISVTEGGLFHVTGTTTITDIDPATDKAGRHFVLVFDGALTLTHHATTLILPGGINITTAAGDSAIFASEGSDAVRCINYRTANGSVYMPTDQSIYIAGAKALSHNSGSGFFAINEGAGAGSTRIYGGIVFLGSSLATYVGTGGFITMTEQTAPAAPPANCMTFWIEDNGSGKTRYMVRFATGAAIQIAIEA